MKKIFIAIISLILSVSCLLSAVGCSSTTEESKEPIFQGTHVYTAVDSGKKLVENGRTDYVIVVPEQATSFENTAKNEFVSLFKKATDIRLKVIVDTGLSHDDQAKYISIGDTTLLATSGITVDKEALTHSGCRIVTKGNTVYISGGEREGVVYSVYDFMEIMFNFDVFYKDCLTIDTGVTNVALMNFDVTDIPDFVNRIGAYNVLTDTGSNEDQRMFKSRMRVNDGRNHHIGIYKEFNDRNSGASGGTHCTTRYILQRDKYAEDHPNWFSDNGEQWCYTAHGNKEEYDLMVKEIVLKCLNSLQFNLPENTDPTQNTFFLAQEDNGDSCSCTSCVAATAKYGAQSGAMIVLINDVSDLFREMYLELQEAEPDNPAYSRDVDFFYFQMFAYLFSVEPPTKYNETTGKYEATYPEVICRDNVIVEIAATNIWTWYSMLSEDNAEGRAVVQGWGNICKNIEYWVYYGSFRGHAYPTVDFNFVNGESYAWLASNNTNMFYAETSRSSSAQTAWHNLTMYVTYKLQWNTSLDVKELQNRWFKGMFKDDKTVAIMQELFDEVDQYRRHIYLVDGGEKNFMGKPIGTSEYFPYRTVKSWLDKCDLALESIEKYKGMEIYDQIYFNIEMEAISPMFLMLNLYKSTISKSYKEELINRLKYDIENFNIGTMKVDKNDLSSWLNTII